MSDRVADIQADFRTRIITQLECGRRETTKLVENEQKIHGKGGRYIV